MAKTDSTSLSDEALEAFFVAARAEAPQPGPELMARIIADAEAELDAREAAPARIGERTGPARLAGRLRNFVNGLGGWPALASMATAALAGVWIGFAAPDSIDSFAGGLLLPATETATTSYELEDLLPGYDAFAALVEEDQG